MIKRISFPAEPLVFYPFIAVLLTAMPFMLAGLPLGHDIRYSLVRVVEYQAAWAEGQWLPFWAPDLYCGYGSPMPLYYPPLFSTVAGLLGLLTGSVISGSVAALILFGLVACLGVARLVREVLPGDRGVSAPAARIAVYCLLLNPYWLSDIYVRNAFSEYAALCLAPLPLLGMAMILKEPRRGLMWLAFGLAALILCHVLIAMVVMGLILLAAVILHSDLSGRGRMVSLGAGGLLGLGISSFYWWPAYTLRPQIQMERLLTGHVDFHGNFVDMADLFGFSKFYSGGWVVPLVFLVAGAVLLGWRGGNRSGGRWPWWLWAGGVLLLVLQLEPAQVVWEVVPDMALMQFPWRLMGVASLLAALLSAWLFWWGFRGRNSARIKLAEYLVFVTCTVHGLPVLSDIMFVHPEEFQALFSRPQIRERALGLQATLNHEFLPRGAHATDCRNAGGGRPTVIADAADRVEVVEDLGTRIMMRLESSVSGMLRIPRWTYPGWVARIDGRPAPLQAGPQGELELHYSAGHHVVLVELEPPSLRSAGLLISLLSLLTTLWFARGIGGNVSYGK